MKTNLRNEKSVIKREVLSKLIPHFPEREIVHMTGIPQCQIGYYRRKDKITTHTTEHKTKVANAMRQVREAEEGDRQYAKELVYDILEGYGIICD